MTPLTEPLDAPIFSHDGSTHAKASRLRTVGVLHYDGFLHSIATEQGRAVSSSEGRCDHPVTASFALATAKQSLSHLRKLVAEMHRSWFNRTCPGPALLDIRFKSKTPRAQSFSLRLLFGMTRTSVSRLHKSQTSPNSRRLAFTPGPCMSQALLTASGNRSPERGGPVESPASS